MIEFAIADLVRQKFPLESEAKNKHSMCISVDVAGKVAHQAVADSAEREVGSASIACRAGCNHCCHMRVVVTVPEIIFLYEYVAANFSTVDRADLNRRIVSLDTRSHGLSDEEWGVRHWQCPMLVGGLCSVYPARPLECRGYNSTDVAACAAAAEDYSEWDVPMNDELMAAYKSAQAGLLHGLVGAGYRPRLVELVAGLRVVFDDPTAIDRWLQGENPFSQRRD